MPRSKRGCSRPPRRGCITPLLAVRSTARLAARRMLHQKLHSHDQTLADSLSCEESANLAMPWRVQAKPIRAHGCATATRFHQTHLLMGKGFFRAGIANRASGANTHAESFSALGGASLFRGLSQRRPQQSFTSRRRSFIGNTRTRIYMRLAVGDRPCGATVLSCRDALIFHDALAQALCASTCIRLHQRVIATTEPSTHRRPSSVGGWS